VGKYKVGQFVNAGGISGHIIAINPEAGPGQGGKGTLDVTPGPQQQAVAAVAVPVPSAAIKTIGTSNIGKYKMGQHVSAGGVTGNVIGMKPNTPGATSGPGTLDVAAYDVELSKAAAPVSARKKSTAIKCAMPDCYEVHRYEDGYCHLHRAQAAQVAGGGAVMQEQTLEVVGTSQVAKYEIGQQVSGLGGGSISGYICKITANAPGATSGPGRLFIGLLPPGF
jgi:hypothetical protein